jgi:hypothetical protein
MLLQNQQITRAAGQIRIWPGACITSMRLNKLKAKALKSLKDKFSLGSTARSPKEDVMKRNLIGIISLVALTVLLNPASANAQARVKADVPFAFTVGNTQLPAGCYEISSAQTDSTIMLRNCDTGKAVLSHVRPEYPRDTKSEMVFHRLGNQYFLSEIWGAAGNAEVTLPASKQEQELLAAARQSQSGKEVAIALNK